MLRTERTVRIILFGRPYLTSDGVPLKFKAPQRVLSLLGYLLLRHSEPLTRDRIAFALWPDVSEADARANLRRHLFYLTNDVLPPAPAGVSWILADKRTIAWNGDAPASCDVLDFQRLTASSTSAAEAVALYAGDFLEGLEDEWIQEPREQLRERQIAVLLGLIKSSRDEGDAAAGIAYARRLLGIDPWREDAIRALIALRHVAGDRAGALSTYREFAKRLDAEMGVEPMPETSAEYERVAAALEPAHTSHPPSEIERSPENGNHRGAVRNAYWNPVESLGNADAMRSTPSFTGRAAQLAAIDEALWRGTGRAAVHGLGGVGKSVVAREYARRNCDRYAAVWWLNAESEAGIVDGLVRLGSTFVPALAALDDRRAAAEHVVANVLRGFSKPALLLFDNLEDERLLHRWCPALQGHALVTSRSAVWSGDVVPIHLETWHAEEAIDYLRREAGRSDISNADAVLIAEALGYLPLALGHAAAYLKRTANVGAHRYLQRLGEHLARAPKGADYSQAVFATLEQAITRAEEDAPGAAPVLCLAAFYAADALPEEVFRQQPGAYGSFTVALRASRSSADLRTTVASAVALEEALGALHRFSLVTYSSETGTYAMHRLVQDAARHLLAGDEAQWARTAIAVAEAAFPEVRFELWPDCQRLVPHARVALARLDGDVCFPPAARLATRCGTYLRKRAAFGDAESLLRRGVATAETCARSEPYPEIGDNIAALASLLRDTNRLVEAEPLLRRSLAIRQAAMGPEHPSVAAVLNDLAILLHYSNRLAEAQALFRRALAIDEAVHGAEHPLVALRLGNLAIALHETNVLDEAERLFRRALAMEEIVNGRGHPDFATGLINLGWLLLETGRGAEAEPLLLQATAIYRATYGESHPSYAHALSDLAVLLHDTGRSEAAEGHARSALALFVAAYGEDHPVVAACANNLAEFVGNRGGVADAEELYRRALASDETNYGPEHTTVARDLNNLAGLLFRTERESEADVLLRRALAIVKTSYAANHPRVRVVIDNTALLHAGGERAKRRTAGSAWRAMRRSPSRSLR